MLWALKINCNNPSKLFFVKASMMWIIDLILHGKLNCQRHDGDEDNTDFTNHNGFIDHVELTNVLVCSLGWNWNMTSRRFALTNHYQCQLMSLYTIHVFSCTTHTLEHARTQACQSWKSCRIAMKMQKHGVKPWTLAILFSTAYVGTFHKSLNHV
jgi:hypothetical protein